MNKKGIIIVIGVIAFALLAIWYVSSGGGATFGTKTYEGRLVSFSYPGQYEVQEYSTRAVAVGKTVDGLFVPEIEISEYREDRDSKLVNDYDTFIFQQTRAICATDKPGVTVKCTGTNTKKYETADDANGNAVMLRGTKTYADGTVEPFEFGPVYVFNRTIPADENDPIIYRALMIYPSFARFMDGEADASLLDDRIMPSLVINQELSTITRPEGASPTIPSPGDVLPQ